MKDWWPTLVTIIVYFIFWSIWPVATWIIAVIILAALLGFLYGVGSEIMKREEEEANRAD